MDRERQDKLWNDLSKENKQIILDRYDEYLEDDIVGDTYVLYEYEYLFGKHNLNK